MASLRVFTLLLALCAWMPPGQHHPLAAVDASTIARAHNYAAIYLAPHPQSAHQTIPSTALLQSGLPLSQGWSLDAPNRWLHAPCPGARFPH